MVYPDGVSAIDCDLAAQARPGDQALRLLGPDAYRVGGWNHINGVGAFDTVSLPPQSYAISASNYVEDPSCGGVRSLGVILVKKTYDWDRQHANGMESRFDTERLTFGEVEDVVIELRLRPDVSTIPGPADLAAAYGDLLTADQIDQLDDGLVHLEVTLFGTGATAEAPFMNASALVTIDQAQVADGWVRIQIPHDAFDFYTEENYVRTPVGADAWQDLTIAGLRINPETAQRLTARYFLLDDFDPAARPELFKEMGMAIALIEIGRAKADAS